MRPLIPPSFYGGPRDWSQDGSRMLIIRVNPQSLMEVGLVQRDDAGRWRETPVRQTSYSRHLSMFSPDGRYVVYSTGSGDTDHENLERSVFVESFPDGEERLRVALSGRQPRWARKRNEIYYLDGGDLVAVEIRTEPRLEILSRKKLFRMFELPYVRHNLVFPQYDAAPDGEWFLKIDPVDRRNTDARPRIRVVQNWAEGYASD